MSNIFGNVEVLERSWKSLLDVNKNLIQQWNHSILSAGINTESSWFRRVEEVPESEPVKKMIHVVKDELSQIKRKICTPHLFVLTNHLGIALQISGENQVIHSMEEHNIGVGTSFALECAGINGVSAAMQLQDLVVVQGREHSLEFFSQWSCICAPIRRGQEIHGYLDFSFDLENKVTLAVELVARLVHDIEKKLELDNDMKKTDLFEQLKLYGLTNQENEVAFYWYQGITRSQIGEVMHISENTVKTHIRNLSEKIGVSGRKSFLMKFCKHHP